MVIVSLKCLCVVVISLGYVYVFKVYPSFSLSTSAEMLLDIQSLYTFIFSLLLQADVLADFF